MKVATARRTRAMHPPILWCVATAKPNRTGDFAVKTLVAVAALSAAALSASAALAQQASTTTTTTVVSDARTGQVAAIGVASTTASAPVANPSAATTPPTTANADTGYTGDLQGKAFHSVEERIAMAEGKVTTKAQRAMLAKIKGEAKFRRARHGGELRDWDRELLNKQLDQLQAMTG